jgi:hypothetical protein
MRRRRRKELGKEQKKWEKICVGRRMSRCMTGSRRRRGSKENEEIIVKEIKINLKEGTRK